MYKFNIGLLVQTREIAEEIENNEDFKKEIIEAYNKYINCNWGETHEEDKILNDNAVKNNNDRIVAKYRTSKGDIFIITEIDRTYTTIMFTHEY